MKRLQKKVGILVAVTLLITSLFTACGNNEEKVNSLTDKENKVVEDVKTDASTEVETQKNDKEENKEVDEDKVQNDPINVAVLKGPTGMGMVRLMEDHANGQSVNPYKFSVGSDASVVMTKIIAGDYDIAALPTNTAAVLYGKTEGNIQMLAINTYGNLYLVQNTENAEPITSVVDLKGKTITMFGQGANPEYVMSYILEQNGLKVGEDVILDFRGAVDEVLAAVAAGDCDYALLPEPNTTVALTKNQNFTTVLNISEEWNKTSEDGKLVMGCIVASKDFIEENKEAVDAFVNEYGESIQYVMENTEEASKLIEKYEIVGAAAVAKKALPGSNLTFISGKDMQGMVEGYYKVLHSYNPTAIGGSIPDENMYYISE